MCVVWLVQQATPYMVGCCFHNQVGFAKEGDVYSVWDMG